jgi:hypothetical protein
MEAVLWPGRGVRGVLSHETALDLFELGDVNPAKIDVTLPRGHRVRRAVPSLYRLHYEDLALDDVTVFEGIPIVTPVRAIRQAHAAQIGPALVMQAIDQCGRRWRRARWRRNPRRRRRDASSRRE